MAHEKKLLDDVSSEQMIDLIESVKIKRMSFKDDDTNRVVEYNKMFINLTNGDQVEVKLDPLAKAAFFYALKDMKPVK